MLEGFLALFIFAFVGLGFAVYWYLSKQQRESKIEKRSYAVATEMAALLSGVIERDAEEVPFLSSIERNHINKVLKRYEEI